MDASNHRRARAIESNLIRLQGRIESGSSGSCRIGRRYRAALDGSRSRRVQDSSSHNRWKLRGSVLPVYEESTTPDRRHLDGGCIRGDRASGTALPKTRMCSSSSGQRGGRPDVPTTVADRESWVSQFAGWDRHDECPDDELSRVRMCGTAELVGNRDLREPGRRVSSDAPQRLPVRSGRDREWSRVSGSPPTRWVMASKCPARST